ncbi:hypothetical protein SeMB42_g05287 [Synchytrium endobioticum]|uniref:Nucleolar protein 9 n=1 Tax=Synchytrium endobioticum TaxID=286115 RepID=A0A507CPJ7_9FUNG|nr:hypothetical protein SeLEV6574_g06271 [Synchytrium endobioticum]TPX42097.1 hypothetical protein SeMB42_g05287 [Synchytrium endobioticum]
MTKEKEKKTRRGSRAGKQKRDKLQKPDAQIKKRKLKQKEKLDDNDSVIISAPIPPPKEPLPIAGHPTLNFTPASTSSTTHPERQQHQELQQPEDYWLVKPDLRHYLNSIEGTLQHQFGKSWNVAHEEAEDDEDKQLLLRNAFKEMKGSEKEIAGDAECSRILEALLDVVMDEELIQQTFEAFQKHFNDLAKHRIASHVMQKVIRLVEAIARRHDNLANSSFLNFCKVNVAPQAHTLVSDRYGTHVLRTIFSLLCGHQHLIVEAEHRKQQKFPRYNPMELKEGEESLQGPKSQQGPNGQPTTQLPVTPEYTSTFESLCSTMMQKLETSVLQVLAFDKVANPTLQLLLLSEKTSLPFLDKLFAMANWSTAIDGPRNDFLIELFRHPIGSRLAEKLIMNADGRVLRKLYMTYLSGHLMDLCQNSISNFVVQKYISRLITAKQLNKVIKELCEHFSTFFHSSRIGVCSALVSASARIGAHHQAMFDALVAATSTDPKESPQEFLKKILYRPVVEPTSVSRRMEGRKRKSNDIDEDIKERIHIQGAIIVESLIQFPNEYSQFVLAGYLNLPKAEAVAWAFDPTASRMLERLIRTEQIRYQSKQGIYSVFGDKYTQMAIDRSASHVVDSLFKLADIDKKQQIAANLSQNFTPISNSLYGRLVLRNLRIEEYRKSKADWTTRWNNLEKKKLSLNSFVDEITAAANAFKPTIRSVK